jgi:hypothetical protein
MVDCGPSEWTLELMLRKQKEDQVIKDANEASRLQQKNEAQLVAAALASANHEWDRMDITYDAIQMDRERAHLRLIRKDAERLERCHIADSMIQSNSNPTAVLAKIVAGSVTASSSLPGAQGLHRECDLDTSETMPESSQIENFSARPPLALLNESIYNKMVSLDPMCSETLSVQGVWNLLSWLYDQLVPKTSHTSEDIQNEVSFLMKKFVLVSTRQLQFDDVIKIVEQSAAYGSLKSLCLQSAHCGISKYRFESSSDFCDADTVAPAATKTTAVLSCM